MINKVVIIAQYRGIGIDAKLNGYDMLTEKKVKKNFYNGRLCFGKQRVGIASLRKEENRCNVIIGGTPW
jgi:hypothetical protein